MAQVVKTWPYWPVIRHPTLRRIMPGIAISSLGDGMGMVAVAWLALQLVPGAAQGLWVAAAEAAYSLPGVLGGLALSRLLARRAAARLAGWNAALVLPTGTGGSVGLALAGFGAGGLIYAPFPAIEATLVQRISPAGDLAAVLAAQGAITVLAPSIGEVLGGPLVTAIGARLTLLLSATVTIALGVATGLGVAVRMVARARSSLADARPAKQLSDAD